MSSALWGDRTKQDPASRAERKLRMEKAQRAMRRKRPNIVSAPSDNPLKDVTSPEFAAFEVGKEWSPEDFDG